MRENYSAEERKKLKIKTSDVLSLKIDARNLYYIVQQNINIHLKEFKYPGDLIKVLYEISHKRMIRDIIFHNTAMQEYFNKITVEKLRPNDFYNLGHILHNQVIRKNIST